MQIFSYYHTLFSVLTFLIRIFFSLLILTLSQLGVKEGIIHKNLMLRIFNISQSLLYYCVVLHLSHLNLAKQAFLTHTLALFVEKQQIFIFWATLYLYVLSPSPSSSSLWCYVTSDVTAVKPSSVVR